VNEQYWAGAAAGVLRLQRCARCGSHQFYPRPLCISCGAEDVVWVDTCGRGVVHTFTIVRKSGTPAVVGDAPFVVAIVELEEGPRLTTNVRTDRVDDVYIGMPVTACFDVKRGERTYPIFVPEHPAADDKR
jgi:uncharacterized OB-fold protein